MNTTTTYNLPPVMTMAEVAQALCVHEATAYEMARGDGPLAHLVVRVGSAGTGIRIMREDFLAWMKAGGVTAERGR